MKTLLILLLAVTLCNAQNKPTKTPQQQASTALSSLKRANTPESLAATVRALYWSWYAQAPTRPGNEVSFQATTPAITTSKGFVWPSTAGRMLFCTDTTENEPAVRDGAWRFVPGRRLYTAEPIMATERTMWVLVKREGTTPSETDQGNHRLIDHGRDMALMAMSDGVFVVSFPHPANNNGAAFDFKFFRDSPRFDGSWQLITVRYRANSISLSINGKDVNQTIVGGTAPRTEPVRVGQYEKNFGAMNASVKAWGFVPRYLTDEEVRKLETALK